MEISLRHILTKWNLFHVKAGIRVYSSRVRSERSSRRRPVITENRTRNYPINNTDNHYKTSKYFHLVANITMEDRNLSSQRSTATVKRCLCYRDIKRGRNLNCVLRFQLLFRWVYTASVLILLIMHRYHR